MPVTIYHNPRCAKSRETLKLIRDKGIEPEVVDYQKTAFTPEKLKEILGYLQMAPRNLMRTKEKIYKELQLSDPNLSDEALIAAMIENPKLIERPIVVVDGRAALGRPPEAVLELF